MPEELRQGWSHLPFWIGIDGYGVSVITVESGSLWPTPAGGEFDIANGIVRQGSRETTAQPFGDGHRDRVSDERPSERRPTDFLCRFRPIFGESLKPLGIANVGRDHISRRQ